jgi:hypothetical protein
LTPLNWEVLREAILVFGFWILDLRAALVAVLAFVGAPGAVAQAPRLAEPALARQLQQRVTLAWHGQELGPALERLAEVQKLPLWIDRRVDPHAAIELAVDDATLADALDRVAAAGAPEAWGWSTLGSVVYFGPRRSARELATLATLARRAIPKAPAAQRRQWLTAAAWEYPRLSEPRSLLRETLAPLGATVRNEDELPHDLWPARSLWAVAPIDRVVLLLAGFDLAGEPSPDGRQWRLAPIKRPVQITRDYPRNERSEAASAAIVEANPEVRIKKQGRRLEVAGRWEDHERMRTAIRGDAPAEPTPAAPAGGERRFTLKIENKPVGRVLEQLAAQLQLTLVWMGEDLMHDALVSCDVREADLDGLLTAILAPAKLTFEREGQTVTIRAAE